MSAASERHDHDDLDRIALYAMHALPPDELANVETHLAACETCRNELEGLRPMVDTFVAWPTDVLRPAASLWKRLAHRIGAEAGANAATHAPPRPTAPRWAAPEWQEAAPGISCKVLATDAETHRVSMLVRLAPGIAYPPHEHADVEELFLLDGELVIDGRTLYPGDYNRAEPGTADQRVWSETGCTCVLVTSARDILR